MQSLPLLTGVDKNKRPEEGNQKNARRRVEGARLFDEMPWGVISSIYEMIPFENEELETLEMIFQSRHFPPSLRERAFNFFIRRADATAIANEMSYVPDLSTFNLEGNRIGSAGARAIAGALRRVPSLTTLILSSNRIGSIGARAIAGALRHVPSLTHLESL